MKTVFSSAMSLKRPLSIQGTVPKMAPRMILRMALAVALACLPLRQTCLPQSRRIKARLRMEMDAEVVAPVATEEPGYQVVDVGVLAIRGYKATINRWQPLMGWLETQIPNSYFRLHPLSLDELAKALKPKGSIL